MPKYDRFASVLEMRIRKGDYLLRDFPTEQELADEIGASRMTARRALLQLMNKGLLVRKPHGKIEINLQHEQASRRPSLAFLQPAFSSPIFEGWRYAVERAAQKFNTAVRKVDFVHWDDPVIPQTLAGFEGVFLVPSSEPIPQSIIGRLSSAKNLIALDTDLTHLGLPSVQLLPPMFVARLADHLYELGHRRIDCLNTQPHDEVVTQRIAQWQLWQRMHIDEPIEPFEHETPRAHEVITRLLKNKRFKATALLTITGGAAHGAVRAFHDAGLTVGKDVSVCAVEGGGLARYHVPSLTSLQPPDPAPYIDACLDWFNRRGDAWVGPLLVQPASVSLFVGESTGPAPAAADSEKNEKNEKKSVRGR
jgi:DNA-binding LacI/PurR family transcriptional regulator